MNSESKRPKQKRESRTYFLDSYAVIEILDENPNYGRFQEDEAVITKMNLFEVFEACFRKWGEKAAWKFMDGWKDFTQKIPLEVIGRAAIMRQLYKKRGLSMTDCVGYQMAQYLEIPFLTGDKEFEGMENVEFVK